MQKQIEGGESRIGSKVIRLRRRNLQLPKKKEEHLYEEGYCYRCKEHDPEIIGGPCRFRDYPDYHNPCLSYSINNKVELREGQR